MPPPPTQTEVRPPPPASDPHVVPPPPAPTPAPVKPGPAFKADSQGNGPPLPSGAGGDGPIGSAGGGGGSPPPQIPVGPTNPPRRISAPTPRYPPGLKAQGILEGQVGLRVEIDATGRVTNVVVVSPSEHEEFNRAAIDAASRSTYEPARVDGVAVARALEFTVRFRIRP